MPGYVLWCFACCVSFGCQLSRSRLERIPASAQFGKQFKWCEMTKRGQLDQLRAAQKRVGVFFLPDGRGQGGLRLRAQRRCTRCALPE